MEKKIKDDKDLRFLVMEEKRRIIEKHGLFNSTHEFYAVLKEEIEESKEMFDWLEGQINSDNFNNLWGKIKRDKCLIETVSHMKKWVADSIKEMIQVLAVLEKYQEGLKK
jgi:hypothetical protein